MPSKETYGSISGTIRSSWKVFESRHAKTVSKRSESGTHWILIFGLTYKHWISWVLDVRSEAEAQSIYDDGMAFLKLHLHLTLVSLRTTINTHAFFTSFSGTPHRNRFGTKHLSRTGIQEWFVRPKFHVPWRYDRSLKMHALVLLEI